MIHLVTWLPLPYQQTLFRVLSDRYVSQFLVWFGQSSNAQFPFKKTAGEGFRSRYLDQEGYRAFFKALRADPEPVVILGGWHSPMSARALIATTLLRTPVFIWADHPHPKQRGLLLRIVRKSYLKVLNRLSDGFLACGTPTVQHLVSLGIDEAKITLFPYWTELPAKWSAPRRGPEQPNSQPQPLRLIAIGRLVNVKQFNVAIEAVSIANKKAGYAVAKLLVAGEGPERGSLERLVQEKECGDSVEFSGWLEAEDISQVLDSSDVFVIPSEFEPYGAVVLEAMALGRPILASNGVVAAVDRDEGTGAIVFHDAGDARHLAQQILWFAEDYERVRKASLAARRTAEKWPPARAVEILNQALRQTRIGQRLVNPEDFQIAERSV